VLLIRKSYGLFTGSPGILFRGIFLIKVLRNQFVAVIFATAWLQEMNPMKRDVFQAVADPTRRAILILIASQAMTPNALADHFETSRQAVSKHIQFLMECDVIRSDKVGREIYYGLKMDKMDNLRTWFDQLRRQWEDRFEQLDQVLINLKSQQK